MRKICILFAIVCTSLQLLAQEKINIKHLNGETSIPKNPKRVVVLDMGTLETCHALNVPVIGGLGNVENFMPKYSAKNKYTAVGSVPKADIAAVAQLKPDLIITSTRQRAQFDSLATIAPTIVLGTSIENFWETFEGNVHTVGKIFNKEKEANQKLTDLRAKLAKVQIETAKDPNKGVVLLHVNNKLVPNAPNSRFGFAHDVLQLKPAYVADPSAEGQTTKGAVSTPALESLNPDYIFIFDRATGIQGTMPVLADLVNDDVKNTAAYKNNKVFLLPGFTWYLSGSGLLSVDRKITDIGEMLYTIKF